MTRPELDALFADYDRWEAYDGLIVALTVAFGLLLVVVGVLALWSAREGLGGLLATVGVAVVGIGLNKRPYQAR